MEKQQSLDPNYLLWVFLNMTSDALLKARQKELNQYDISNRQAMALLIIQAIDEKVTAAEISRWSFRETHTVTDILSRMEKQGLIRRDKNLHRKNLVRISLTAKGQEVYNKSLERESIKNIMSVLSEEERLQLSFYLEKLWNKALQELGMEQKLPLIMSQSE